MTRAEKNTIAGPPIPKLPILGTSWYRRGPSYWVRRAWIPTIMAFVLVVAAALGLGVFKWILTVDPLWLRVAIFGIASGGVALSLFRGLRALHRVRLSRQVGTPITLAEAYRPGSGSLPSRRGAVAVGSGVGAAAGAGAAAGSDALGGLLAIAVIFIYGDLLAAFLASLLKYLNPEEMRAVQAVENWKAAHPDWAETRR